MRPTENEDEDQMTVEPEDDFGNNNGKEGEHADYVAPDLNQEGVKYQLSGMYKTWFLEYASYVILDRAVPHLDDGLKPVQRRVLFAMKRMDDGNYNKVANIVGSTMQFHPHGDASIYGALVNLGQKDYLVDCQGNWGNIYTGHQAAAPRYIEAKLSKFALDVMFNNKTTIFKKSYDARNDEPVTLPVKFPLLLAQGAEGIAVTLSSIILPHNFNEIIDASIAYLNGEDFQLYPDFPTGGMVDVSRYNDGGKNGRVVVRAHISKIDSKTLVVTDIPYGETTGSVRASIVSAVDKGKINIKNVEDDTAANVEIRIHLGAQTSSDKTIDALYAFTSCQKSISPVCCVIKDKKPMFTNVSELLRISVDRTKDLLRQELEIQLAELQEKLLYASLEKIFIEEGIYKDKGYEQAKNMDEAVAHIDKRLDPFKPSFIREITREDILRLPEIKMARIFKFNSFKSEEEIAKLNEQIEETKKNLAHLVEFTINWFATLKEKYGKKYPRRTEIRSFDNISATKVVEANEKLYVNREEGFLGTSLKKDEFVGNCSSIDDVIVFFKDGRFKVLKVQDKVYVGKDIMHIAVYKKKDTRTVYNVVYRDGKIGAYYMKRFAVPSITRDKEYTLTQGKPGSKVIYFSANSNAEAEVIRIVLRPKFRLKVSTFERDFGALLVKGRQAMGNLLTKNEVMSIKLKSKGGSTMGGRKVWFDWDVFRLNYDGRGELLGEFQSEDSILVVSKNGDYYTTTFDDTNHFADNILRIEKFDASKIWTCVLFDANEGFKYIKRFMFESSQKPVNFIGENPKSQMILLTDTYYPRIEVKFGGKYADKEPQEIDVESFIGVKGIKAKGKRLNNQWEVGDVNELEPLRFPEPEVTEAEEEEPDVAEEGTEEEGTEKTLFDQDIDENKEDNDN